MSSVCRKSQKHEARKYVGISWNSNLKLPCENNCDLIKKMLYNLLEMLKFGEKEYPTFMHIFMQLLNIICRGYRFNHLPFIQMNHFDLVKNKKLQLNEMTYLIVKCFKICHIFGWNMKSQLVFHFLCYYKDQRIH